MSPGHDNLFHRIYFFFFFFLQKNSLVLVWRYLLSYLGPKLGLLLIISENVQSFPYLLNSAINQTIHLNPAGKKKALMYSFIVITKVKMPRTKKFLTWKEEDMLATIATFSAGGISFRN